MNVRVVYIDPQTGKEIDKFAGHLEDMSYRQTMTPQERYAMEDNLVESGRYWLDCDHCVYKVD